MSDTLPKELLLIGELYNINGIDWVSTLKKSKNIENLLTKSATIVSSWKTFNKYLPFYGYKNILFIVPDITRLSTASLFKNKLNYVDKNTVKSNLFDFRTKKIVETYNDYMQYLFYDKKICMYYKTIIDEMKIMAKETKTDFLVLYIEPWQYYYENNNITLSELSEENGDKILITKILEWIDTNTFKMTEKEIL